MPTTADIQRYQSALSDAHTYADWTETGDVARAQKFVTAVERLLLLVPDQSERSSQSVRFDKKLWLDRLNRASEFVTARRNAAGGGFAYYETCGGQYE